MLYQFVTTYREAIIARAREKMAGRPFPSASTHELETGVPLFLTQLAETLRIESTGTPHSARAIGSSAAAHGGELMALGFTVSEVVHDYGDICQAVTELAIEQNAPIAIEEFRTLNACLDTAIAEAVTEHARLTAESGVPEYSERSGRVAYESRDLLNAAILAYQALKRGTVAINGSTGAVLGRSLMGLRDIIESSVSEIRIAGHPQKRERVSITPFLNGIAVTGRIHAESRGVTFVHEPSQQAWTVTADPQVLASAVTNLLSNAFKFTRTGGRVVLRAYTRDDAHLLIEVEDECGGIPDSDGDVFQSSGRERDPDLAGLGLGLSSARKAVRAHGGEIHVRNAPGTGCVFVIDLPLAAGDMPSSSTVTH